MKLRNRYLIFLVKYPLILTLSELREVIRNEFISIFGEKDYALSNFNVIYFDYETYLGIARCRHKYLDLSRTILTLINNINGVPVAIFVIKVTGTMKKAIRILKSRKRYCSFMR